MTLDKLLNLSVPLLLHLQHLHESRSYLVRLLHKLNETMQISGPSSLPDVCSKTFLFGSIQPHQLPCCGSNTPSSFAPPGLCTLCSHCQDPSFPRQPHALVLQVSAQKPLPQSHQDQNAFSSMRALTSGSLTPVSPAPGTLAKQALSA